MKEKVFEELIKKGLQTGDIWYINNINAFRTNFNNVQQDELRKCLDELTHIGFFEFENKKGIAGYRLTEKGYNILQNN